VLAYRDSGTGRSGREEYERWLFSVLLDYNKKGEPAVLITLQEI
jgi:hypothetical protein